MLPSGKKCYICRKMQSDEEVPVVDIRHIVKSFGLVLGLDNNPVYTFCTEFPGTEGRSIYVRKDRR